MGIIYNPNNCCLLFLLFLQTSTSLAISALYELKVVCYLVNQLDHII